MNDPKDRWLSLFEAVVEIADPEKLSRFDTLAREFGRGRDLIALLSEPDGYGRHLWSRQYELRAQGKDASRLCSEMQDLHPSLIDDFRAAAIAGRFNGRCFIRGVTQNFDPKELFGLSGLQLRLDKNTIELPEASN